MAVIQSADETMSSLSSAVPFTTLPARAKVARVQVRTQAIHYREDGGTPTSTVGHQIQPTGYFYVRGREKLENFRVIQDTASASIYVSYYDHIEDQ